MNRLVGCLTRGAKPQGNRLEAAVGRGLGERLVEGDLALAWRPGRDLAVRRSDGVVCAVAGRPQRNDRGAADPDATATEIASAYARAGAACLDGLHGAFAILVWDGGRGHGLLAVDPLGTTSIVFHQTPKRLLFALELADLLPVLDRRPPPNDSAVAQWLANGTIARDETLYSGVDRLEGGHLLELRSPGWSKRRYWQPEYIPPDQAPREEHERRLREAIGRAVARRSTGESTSGVLLSGGLDSAVVAAVAAPLVPDLRAYSLVFPAHSEVDEEALIEDVARELGIPSRRVPVRGGGMLAAALDYLREWRTPPVSPNLAVQRPLLELAAGDGATTLLDGQGGDELFGSSLYLLADLVRSRNPFRAVELSRRIEGIPEELRTRAARRALYEFGLKEALPGRVRSFTRRIRRPRRPVGPPWLSDAASRTLAAADDPSRWVRTDGPRWWAHLADELTAQRERAGAHEYLRHRNAMSHVCGAHPFLQDLELIQLVLRLPPELAFDRRYDRPLLRSAMNSVVPDRVRLRAEKSFFTPLFVEALSVHDHAKIRELLTASDAEIRAYARPEVVRERLLDAPAAQRGGSWAWALWRVVMLECWLRGER